MALQFFSVAIGGAFGAMLRYAVALFLAGYFGAAGWVATLSVNVAGCFLMGMAAAYLSQMTLVSEPLRLAITVGFLGALTTFSTYALDSYGLFQRGDLLTLGSYVLGSVILCFVAFGLGLMFIRQLGLS